MAESSAVARPYAQALFDVAKDDGGNFAQWSDRLAFMTAVVQDPLIKNLISNPRVDRKELGTILCDVCADHIDDHGRNFIRLLAVNRRLESMPAIAAQYDDLRAEAERVVEAELQTAVPVDDAQLQRFEQALEKRLGRTVKLTPTTDPDLLGGAIVRAGDMVIDGSVKAQLQKLAGAISA